jgi:hypothetical protein
MVEKPIINTTVLIILAIVLFSLILLVLYSTGIISPTYGNKPIIDAVATAILLIIQKKGI